MRSLLELPEAYIRPEWRTCDVPGRPWWSLHKIDRMDREVWDGNSRRLTGRMVRCDGAVGEIHQTVKGWRKLMHGYEEDYEWMATMPWSAEECAEYDVDEPLPHPGFRAGQVWGWPRPADQDFPWQFTQLALQGHVSMDLPDPAQSPLFLLSDPCRPDLAPWSST